MKLPEKKTLEVAPTESEKGELGHNVLEVSLPLYDSPIVLEERSKETLIENPEAPTDEEPHVKAA